jgi:hypothetical protein
MEDGYYPFLSFEATLTIFRDFIIVSLPSECIAFIAVRIGPMEVFVQ